MAACRNKYPVMKKELYFDVVSDEGAGGLYRLTAPDGRQRELALAIEVHQPREALVAPLLPLGLGEVEDGLRRVGVVGEHVLVERVALAVLGDVEHGGGRTRAAELVLGELVAARQLRGAMDGQLDALLHLVGALALGVLLVARLAGDEVLRLARGPLHGLGLRGGQLRGDGHELGPGLLRLGLGGRGTRGQQHEAQPQGRGHCGAALRGVGHGEHPCPKTCPAVPCRKAGR